MIKYCVSILAKNILEAYEKVQKIYNIADYIEIRADKFKDFDFNIFKKEFNLEKFIFTIRTPKNGGFFSGSEKKRIELLKYAIANNFGYVDIEYDLSPGLINWFSENKNKTKIIISYHNFNETSNNLDNICKKIIKQKPDVIKIVTKANYLSDNVKIFELLKKYRKNYKVVFHTMGEYGEISRIIGGISGNYFTYTSIEQELTAPGQLSIEKLKNEYKLDRLKRNFKLYGLLGNPIKHSHGYLIHNFAFNKNNINSLYLNFLENDLNSFFKNYIDLINGLSVTIPFKKDVINYLDKIDPKAKLIGSVNTILKKNGKLIGYNTDYIGFYNSLKKYINPYSKRIAILGAGGSARAVLVSLLDKQNDIKIFNRTVRNAKTLAQEFNCSYGDLSEVYEYNPQILINCTSVGMYPKVGDTPINTSKIRNCVVYDLVYNPYYTQFLRLASKHNIIVSGFDMFLRQAQEQFRLFTNINFSYLKYRNYFLKLLKII
ncbi:MAG TPA: shikimate dehydrogenase [Bacteroidota bacterium]|nr:shikimate dehydrogenase [Bacteroidota bacterium]